MGGGLGEELSWNEEAQVLVVADPIGGTIGFVQGHAIFSCMLALVKKGQVTSAIVSNPVLQRTMVAERGRGSYVFENGKKLTVSIRDDLKLKPMALLGVSKSDARLFISHLFSNHYSAISIPAIGESLFNVANGKLDAGIYFADKSDDIAAISLIVEEAGGRVTDLDGNEQRYDGPINGAIISNGLVHKELVELYKQSQS